MAKDSRLGTRTKGSNTPPGGSIGGGNKKIGVIPGKTNPTKPFWKYSKEFSKAKTVDELRSVLSNNGVEMSDKLVNYVKSGELSLPEIKAFLHGALTTMSYYGDGQNFAGFGGYSSKGKKAQQHFINT